MRPRHHLTTDEAAHLAGVSPVTIRRWVMKGWLEPLTRGARPLLFRPDDVRHARHRINTSRHQTLDTLWRRVLAQTPGDRER